MHEEMTLAHGTELAHEASLRRLCEMVRFWRHAAKRMMSTCITKLLAPRTLFWRLSPCGSKTVLPTTWRKMDTNCPQNGATRTVPKGFTSSTN